MRSQYNCSLENYGIVMEGRGISLLVIMEIVDSYFDRRVDPGIKASKEYADYQAIDNTYRQELAEIMLDNF